MPIANGFGASQSQVADALRELDEAGDARASFNTVSKRIRKSDFRDKGIDHYPMTIRLALGMAAHRETERQALQGRLKWLERRWREAEGIAEIADNLFTLPAIVKRLTSRAERSLGRPGGSPGNTRPRPKSLQPAALSRSRTLPAP